MPDLAAPPSAAGEAARSRIVLAPVDLVLCLVLAGHALYRFARRSPTAYDWPSLDMATYFVARLDPSALRNDFFTACSLLPNPRFVFGEAVVALARLLSGSWYAALFLLKTVLVGLLPPLHYLVTAALARRNAPAAARWAPRAVAFLLVLAVASPRGWGKTLDRFVAVGHWEPFHTNVTPHALAMLLLLAGLALHAYRRRATPALVLAAAALLVHPSFALAYLAFYLLFARAPRGFVLASGAVVAGCFAALRVAFPAGADLDAAEFVRHFAVVNNAYHYLPSRFEGLTAAPWWAGALVLSALLLASALAARAARDPGLAARSLLALAGYLGAIAAQYLLVERHPVKLVAILGPSRWTFVGFWAVAVALAAHAGRIEAAREPGRTAGDPRRAGAPALAVAAALVACALALVNARYRDDPLALGAGDEDGVYRWAAASTPPDAVFAAPSNVARSGDLPADLPLKARRAVLVGNGFPFSEACFREFSARSAAVQGTPEDLARTPGAWSGARYANFFRSLGPDDFLAISREHRLDYVVVERAYGDAFARAAPPEFANARYAVYSVGALAGKTVVTGHGGTDR